MLVPVQIVVPMFVGIVVEVFLFCPGGKSGRVAGGVQVQEGGSACRQTAG